AEERLLALLLPVPTDEPAGAGSGAGTSATTPGAAPGATGTAGATGRGEGNVFVVSSTGGVSTASAADADGREDRYGRTREKLKQLLLDGRLEDREVEVEVLQPPPQMFDMLVPQGAPEGMESFSDALKDMLPRRRHK